MGTLSPDPRDRLGVYKRLAEVPDRHRLERYADTYDGRDVWSEYVDAVDLFEQNDSERYERATTRAVDHWKSHLANRGRHHALARPADVDTWCAALLSARQAMTVYNYYWTRVARLYDWLRWHTDHPHLYDPFLMAASEFDRGAAGTVWDAKITHRQQAND